MAPRKKSSPRALPKRKEKEVPAKSSLERRKELEAKMNMSPALSAVTLVERTRTVQCRSPEEVETESPIHGTMRLLAVLKDKVADVQRGDMSGMEEMLVAQAHARGRNKKSAKQTNRGPQ